MAAVAAGLWIVLAAGPAAAEEPLEVAAGITDPAGVLGESPTASAAVDELAAETDVVLRAVVVSSFDGQDVDDWIAETARLSDLAGPDLLFTVAVAEDSYEYGWWNDEAFPLPNVEVEDLITDEVVPALDARDWNGALRNLAEGLQTLAAETEQALVAEEEAADADADEATRWTVGTTIAVLVALAVVLVAAGYLSRRKPPAGSSG